IAETELVSLGVAVSVGRAAGDAESDGDDVLWRADHDLLERRRQNQHVMLCSPVLAPPGAAPARDDDRC
ncbi:MAG: hypothetical protein WBA46_18485, partial [Thermomicrobiales bacterium]